MTKDWHKSTFSAYNGSCVEGREADGGVEIRDSKDRGGPSLRFSREDWAAFLAAIRQGMN